MGGGWLIAPEKTVKEKVRTVCLEHGKKEPRSGQDYAIVPIRHFTDNKTTEALCEMLADDSVDQQAIQVAVWNQECEVSFDELASKVYQPTSNVVPRPWFNKDQLIAGSELIEKAQVRAAELEEEEAEAKKAADLAEEEAILSSESSSGQTEEKVDTLVEDLTKDLTK